MSTKTADRTPARERLLDAAGELFYEEGVHTVGIDRIIERAGVAKASLYNSFGSKDELVKAYLGIRHTLSKERLLTGLEDFHTPRGRLLGVFEIQARTVASPGFRGCAFVGASAESPPGTSVQEASDGYRDWFRGLFLDLAREAGARDPEGLARSLYLLYDGAMVSAWMDRDPTAPATARAIAEVLVDAAL